MKAKNLLPWISKLHFKIGVSDHLWPPLEANPATQDLKIKIGHF